MFLDTVKKLLNQALEERQDLFLIDFKMSNDNAIKVIIDGDKGVTVEDCIFVSRAIEHNIDREEYDFSLEVMSAGAASSFNMPRQFTKHVGRTLEVKTQTETIEGKLTNTTEEEITLEWKSREPKPVGKGKVTVNKKQNIAFKDILEAKVIIKF
ncbi:MULTISPECIES: ribosome assembly cofactor RimP [Mesoflavibacter]|uniref:Ribosome maturation factor RimP n=1 Tax=Mesoflavibacter profundi TaxID=2708110 RepID=A0ABT4S2G9_9FLAO|nr:MULTISPECIES: ribosome assembly cofactor RimP [Mesoflavibacter]MDA0178271.1 ribosome assembly cofactor RimP [Mesoflavibacter profundi]QIJ89233.1 Bacterial ribosome SSU maturation protein RimP [Mesoflavibacter sp. HG96]QIJ91961.1 Bacterial ribosome SSU maturation protein RimP [Mesoflavibacter sp. HG37]